MSVRPSVSLSACVRLSACHSVCVCVCACLFACLRIFCGGLSSCLCFCRGLWRFVSDLAYFIFYFFVLFLRRRQLRSTCQSKLSFVSLFFFVATRSEVFIQNVTCCSEPCCVLRFYRCTFFLSFFFLDFSPREPAVITSSNNVKQRKIDA